MSGRIAKGVNRDFADWLPAVGAPARSARDPDEPKTVLDWSLRYRRIDGRAFSLRRFTPLKAVYEDDHKHICIMKPAQRGVSEYAINRACFALDLGAATWTQDEKDGLNVAYLFPTQASLSDFSKERISGLMGESSHLGEMFGGQGGFAGVTFKQVGNSYLYLRGAWSESALLSFAADVLILDEYDRMDPSALALARRRLAASVIRQELDISTPTLPGKGIHGLYLQSDQMQYQQPCPKCNAGVVYDFLRDVRLDGQDYSGDEGAAGWKDWPIEQVRASEVILTCPTCGGAVSDEERVTEGVWVADRPQIKTLRGYKIPALAFPMADLPRYAAAAVSHDPSEQTEFWRSDMGLPHDAAGSRITEVMLAALVNGLPGGNLPDRQDWREVTMGVDVGKRFHFRISATMEDGERCVRLMGTAGSWEELTRLMVRYQVRRCVVDALPETHGARTWQETIPGRIVRAFYPASVPGGLLFRLANDKMTVNINRTMALDGLYDTVASLDERWPALYCRDPLIIDHLTSSVRVVTLDDRGQERAEWVHTRPDHYAHCVVYDHIALGLLRAGRLDQPLGVFAQGGATGWQSMSGAVSERQRGSIRRSRR